MFWLVLQDPEVRNEDAVILSLIIIILSSSYLLVEVGDIDH